MNRKTSNTEHDDFASMLSDNSQIKPMKVEARAGDIASSSSVLNQSALSQSTSSQNTLALDEAKAAQRQAALGESTNNMDLLRSLSPENYLPQDPMGFKQPGLQNGVYKKLRTGRYEVQGKLDLHGLYVEEALTACLQFIRQSMDAQKRCVLISHGKGIKQDQPARLKNHLAVWLKHFPEVMAYHSALPNQGGTGCVYVLLRKSEQNKQENRERFSGAKNNK